MDKGSEQGQNKEKETHGEFTGMECFVGLKSEAGCGGEE